MPVALNNLEPALLRHTNTTIYWPPLNLWTHYYQKHSPKPKTFDNSKSHILPHSTKPPNQFLSRPSHTGHTWATHGPHVGHTWRKHIHTRKKGSFASRLYLGSTSPTKGTSIIYYAIRDCVDNRPLCTHTTMADCSPVRIGANFDFFIFFYYFFYCVADFLRVFCMIPKLNCRIFFEWDGMWSFFVDLYGGHVEWNSMWKFERMFFCVINGKIWIRIIFKIFFLRIFSVKFYIWNELRALFFSFIFNQGCIDSDSNLTGVENS